MSYTTTVPVTPGQPPTPVQVGATPPVGFTLINRADNGGTIEVAAGANGTQLPLTPGGSLVWADSAIYPYASLPAGATAAETLVVTDQVRDYANPEAVAAATAVQIAAEGVPSTFLDTPYGTYRIPAGQSSAGITVGQSASLVVTLGWPAGPHGLNVALLAFDDPAAPDLDPIVIPVTINNLVESLALTYQVPILAPRLTVTNLQPPDNNNALLQVSVVGNNRSCERVRQIGGNDETGVHNLSRTATFPAGVTTLFGVNGATAHTRFNGPVSLSFNVPAAGFVYAFFVDPSGRANSWPFSVPAGVTQVPLWAHPRVPVYWQWGPNTAGGGPQSVYVAVSPQT